MVPLQSFMSAFRGFSWGESGVLYDILMARGEVVGVLKVVLMVFKEILGVLFSGWKAVGEFEATCKAVISSTIKPEPCSSLQ